MESCEILKVRINANILYHNGEGDQEGDQEELS